MKISMRSRFGMMVVGLGLMALGAPREAAAQEPRRELEEVLSEQAFQEMATQVPEATVTAPARRLTRAASIGHQTAASTVPSVKCLPTCTANDGRFLAIAGSNLITLSRPVLQLAISVPAGATTFQLGFFDGDGRGVDGSGVAHWDTGSAALFEYSLYADPQANGSGTTPVELLSGFSSVLSNTMPDNQWIDYTIATNATAAAPSGNFFYLLKIRMLDPSITALNAFKIRSTATISGLTLNPVPEPFSYIANLASIPDAQLVYPNYPALTPTNYDGTFDFYIDVPVSQTELALWDGDFDRGKFDGTNQDTDDPDTPGAPFLPAWATADTRPEGIAIGSTGTTGNPPDDRTATGLGAYLVKPPSVRYDLIFPDGRTFASNNPSGNQEWEQFRISTDPFDASQMDYSTPTIPPGTYDLKVQGVDMQNLNALYLPFRLICVEANGTPCQLLRPFLVGDTVFADLDGDGNQEAGENGISGVVLELRDALGSLVATTTTDANGKYSFETESATYEVVVASSNFGIGGALYGYVSTTGDQHTDVVTDDNVLTYDFGYRSTASLGNRVWLDLDADGVQDSGESGLAGVRVELLNGNGDVAATTTTNGDGVYTFDHLTPGSYTVRVDASTLPVGLAPTYDLDGTGTAHTTAVTLAANQNRTDVDFGYSGTASLGDRLWVDTDADGAQDAGEAGLNGVTVRLLDENGNTVATTVTGGDGNYSFNNLPAGTFTVSVDSSTLPAGAAPTFDLDGTGSANTATVTLAAGATRTDVDFGYRGTASLGDRVWYDVNGNGAQDGGETGFAGVTVQLLDASNNVVATTVTAANGLYSFGNLMGGTYSVRVDASTLPAGTAPTFDLDGTSSANTATVSLAGGAARTDVDFGYRGTASLGDRVWYDVDGDATQDATENGIAGVTVQLVDGGGNVIATTTTDANGGYSFSNLVAGSYTVRVDANTLPGEGAPTFDLDGTDTPDTAAVTLAAGQTRTDVDFGYQGTGALGDRVWYDINANGAQDADEVGLNGVTVELLDGAGEVLLTATTSGNGGYSFAGLFPGTYTVRVVSSTLPGGAAATYDLDGTASANLATATLAAGQNLTTVDFGYRGTGALGDRVWLDLDADGVQDAGEAGLNNVAVEIVDAAGNILASSSTTSGGLYGFSNLLAGSYTVRVVPSTLAGGLVPTYDLDGTITPNSVALTLPAGGVRTDVDFGYRGTLQFGDRVWFDYDGNGIQDTGEPGIPSVTIELRDASGTLVSTTITGANGNYTFYNLPPGTYTVTIVAPTLPGGAVPTYDLDGTATAGTAVITLNAGQSRSDVDFGYRGTASIGDRVWLDYDADGVQDAGEVGLSGVTVQLLDANNNVIASATTPETGSYTFRNLLAGTYKVRVVTSTLNSCTIQTYDLDGLSTAHIATATVTAGQNRTDVDFGYRVHAPGTGTIGYWKTHPEAWPVSTITIGGVAYTRNQAIVLMGTPSRGDKTIDLFKQLVAAKLNLLAGNNPSCIYQTIASADAWMLAHPPGSNVGSSSSAWTQASPWHTALDNYNNGKLCSPHRD